MSSLVWPTIIGLDVSVERENVHEDEVHETVSGIEQRISWADTPRYRWSLKYVLLRSSVTVVSTGLDEMQSILYFLDQHKGRWDSFLYDCPFDAVQRRVRFDASTLVVKKWASGRFEAAFKLFSVRGT